MKNIITILTLVFLCSAGTMAQDSKAVSVTDIQMVRAEGYVTMTFNFHVGKKATTKDYNLVVNPIIRKANSTIQLASIVVQGSRAKVSEERHQLATGEKSFSQRPFYTKNGATLNYGVTFPYEEWMSGSQLVFEGISIGCCSATEVHIGLMVDNLLYSEPKQEIIQVPVQVAKVVEVPQPAYMVPTPAPAPVLTTGEMLAQRYPFVLPISQLDYSQLDYFLDDMREGGLSIYFAQGSDRIDRNIADNNRVLVELISAVRALNTSPDSRLARVVIAGFASPEGTLQFNDRLAHDRAVAIKQFLQNNSSANPAIITLFNGSVDWRGLRKLVSDSDMYEKRQVLDIIDYTPVWDSRRNMGRHGELMRLHGGATYRYMLQTLFPKLRQAAFIKVYYDSK